MKLFRRPRSPYWWADLTVGGQRYRFSTQREDKEEATAVAATFTKSKLDAHQLGIVPEMTFGEACEKYVLACRKLDNFEGNVIQARRLCGMEIDRATGKMTGRPDPRFGDRWSIPHDLPLSRIGTATVETLKLERAAEGDAPNTINGEIAALQKLYNLARKVWRVKVDPTAEFKKLKVKGKLRYLFEDEEAALLRELDPAVTRFAAAKHPMVARKLRDQYDLVIFLLDTGARYSEVAEITWDCIDTRDWRRVNIYRDKVGNEGLLTMTARLREVLKRRWAARPNSPYVFPGFGEAIGPRGHSTKGLKAAMERAGINADHKVRRFGKATVHSLRDTFASRLVQAGVSLFKVQKLLGHASPQQTQKYAHLAPDAAADEAAAVLDIINGGKVERLQAEVDQVV
jgi:integrase